MQVNEICKHINIDEVKENIIQTSTVAWNSAVTSTSLKKWLANFTGEAFNDIDVEHALAAWLLMHFTYYTESEVEELCRLIYRKFIHIKLNEPKYKKCPKNINAKIQDILNCTIFYSLGNPSESGSLLLYTFRAINDIPKCCFEDRDGKNKIENIVLIDDVTISGEQALSYITKKFGDGICLFFLTFFATQDALERLATLPELTPCYAVLLDERNKIFSDESFLFSNEIRNKLKKHVLKLCQYYGNKILMNESNYMKNCPLGFANGQQIFGFYYNTPDNTLPIFWHDTPEWRSIFKRYSKLYTIEEARFSDEEFW